MGESKVGSKEGSLSCPKYNHRCNGQEEKTGSPWNPPAYTVSHVMLSTPSRTISVHSTLQVRETEAL